MEIVQAHRKLIKLQANKFLMQIMTRANRRIEILKAGCTLNLKLRKLF